MAKRDDDDIPEIEEEAAELADEAEEIIDEAAELSDSDDLSDSSDVSDSDEASESDDVSDSDEAVDADLTDSKAGDADSDDADADDAREDDAEPPEDDDAEPVAEQKPRKKAKVTGLTLTLCILNVLAALGFLFLLMLSYEKRQGYAYFGWVQEWFLVGPGTQEDRTGPTGAVAAMPRPLLTSDALKEAHSKRGGTTSSPEPFSQVEQGFHFNIYRGDLTPEVLRELMNDLGEPVGSIEEEMARLKTKLLPQIDGVGAQLLTNMQKADKTTRQNKVAELLYPLCKNPMQVRALEARIKGEKNPDGNVKTPELDGPALEKILQEAVQRRILADLLWPVEMYRPSDPDRAILEKSADLDMKVDELRDLLTRRLDAATKDKHDGSVHFGKEWDGTPRGTIEKRQNAAFLLVSLAFTRKHLDRGGKLEDQLLEPKGLERAQRISGLFDFTQACTNYNDAIRRLETRVIDALALDREGFRVGADRSSGGFADRHAALLFQIRQVQLQIRQADERIKDLQQQHDRMVKLVEDRTKHSAEVARRIVEERAITQKRNADLQLMQKQLFRALAELADAAETNDRLERQIRVRSGLKEVQP